jgi:hypothetical protein
MMNDLKQRGLMRHRRREFLLYLSLVFIVSGTFALGIACAKVFGGCT